MKDIEPRWVDVVGFEGLYQVSDTGRLRSYPRTGMHNGRWGPLMMRFPAREMKICATPTGYNYLSLNRPGEPRRKYLVHRLVMAAFSGQNAGDSQVNHLDGDKNNNAIGNLEYCTPLQNIRHCIDVLGRKRGETMRSAKLRDADIPKIRADRRLLREIASEYGVTIQAIWYIRKGMNWKWIQA